MHALAPVGSNPASLMRGTIGVDRDDRIRRRAFHVGNNHRDHIAAALFHAVFIDFDFAD